MAAPKPGGYLHKQHVNAALRAISEARESLAAAVRVRANGERALLLLRVSMAIHTAHEELVAAERILRDGE